MNTFKVTFLLMIILLNAAAQKQDKTIEKISHIDRWLDFVDAKTWTTNDIGNHNFKSNGFESTSLWTEAIYDTTLVLNMKVFRNAYSKNQVAASIDDLSKNDIIEYAINWFFLIPSVTGIHVSGHLWKPNFTIFKVKMNGFKVTAFIIKDNYKLCEIK